MELTKREKSIVEALKKKYPIETVIVAFDSSFEEIEKIIKRDEE